MTILRTFCLFLFIVKMSYLTSIAFEAKEALSSSNQITLSLIAESQKFLEMDRPVVSPNGRSIAWTVREKPPQVYMDPSLLENPLNVDFNIIGSKIFIKEDDCTIPIEVSVREKSCWGPSWSPDGNDIAYYSDADGNVELWIYNLKEKSGRKAASIPLSINQYPIQKLLWAPNNEEIYALTLSKLSLEKVTKSQPTSSVSHFKSEEENQSNQNKSNTPFDPSDLVAIDIKNGTSRILLKSETSSCPSSLSISPSGRWVSYTAVQTDKDTTSQVHGNFFEIGVLSANGKIRLSLAESLPIGYSSVVKYLWHPSSDRLYFLADQKIWVAEFSEEGLISSKPIHEFPGNVDSSTMAFTKNEKYLIVGLDAFDAHDYSGNHATKLALIPLDEEMSLKTFNLPENWVFREFISNDAGILWQSTPEAIAFVAKNKDNGTLRSVILLDLETGNTQVIWKGLGILEPIGFDKDQTLYAFYEDFNTPKEISAFDDQFNHLKTLSKTEPAFNKLNVGSYELFETMVPGSNGKLEKVQTAIILPPGAKRGDRLPAIVVHYPGADEASSIVTFGGGDCIGGIPQWLLTSHGFAVILPNLVLGEEAVGKPLQVMTDRLLPQVYQASDLGYIDLNRVGILGQSYGGYGTVRYYLPHHYLSRVCCDKWII